MKTHAEIEAGRLAPKFLLLFKKALCEAKARDLQLSFNILRQPSTYYTTKTNWIKL